MVQVAVGIVSSFTHATFRLRGMATEYTNQQRLNASQVALVHVPPLQSMNHGRWRVRMQTKCLLRVLDSGTRVSASSYVSLLNCFLTSVCDIKQEPGARRVRMWTQTVFLRCSMRLHERWSGRCKIAGKLPRFSLKPNSNNFIGY